MFFTTKVPNKQELQLIGFNNLSDTVYEDFMNLYKKLSVKPYSFLLTDTTLASDNPLCFKKNLLERIYKLIMKTNDKSRGEKLQQNINKEAVKISAFSSRKIDKYEYLTGEEISPSNQSQMV